jgi:hypothetical protein
VIIVAYKKTNSSLVNLTVSTSEAYNVSLDVKLPKSSLLIVKINTSESITWTSASAYPSSASLSVIIPQEIAVVSDKLYEALGNLKINISETARYIPPPPPSGAYAILKVVVSEAQLSKPSTGICGSFGICIDIQDYYSGYVNLPYNYVQVPPLKTSYLVDMPVSGSTPYSELAIDYLTGLQISISEEV